MHKAAVAKYLKANGLSTAAPPSKRVRTFALLDADAELTPAQLSEAVGCRADTAAAYRRAWMAQLPPDAAVCDRCTRIHSDHVPIIEEWCLWCWFIEYGICGPSFYKADGERWLGNGGLGWLTENRHEALIAVKRRLNDPTGT